LTFDLAGVFEMVETEKVGAKQNVGLIRLNRPKALNALCDGLMKDLSGAIDLFESDPKVGSLIITVSIGGTCCCKYQTCSKFYA